MGRDFCEQTPYISFTVHYRMGRTRPQRACQAALKPHRFLWQYLPIWVVTEKTEWRMVAGCPYSLGTNVRLHPEGLSEERDGWWNALLIGDKFAELSGDSGT